MKRYNEFIKESIREKMVGKSTKEIENALKNMSIHDIFTNYSRNQIPKDLLPTKEDVMKRTFLNDLLYWIKAGLIPEEYKPTTEEIKNNENYKKLEPIDKVYLVKNFDLDESLLPSDEEIDKNIEDKFKEMNGISISEAKKLVEDLKNKGIDAKLEIIKDRILEPDNIYVLNSPIRLYYYQIQNGNHVILKTTSREGAEKLAKEIKKYCISLSTIIITEPSGHFDSTTISVKKAIDLLYKLNHS